MQGGHKLHPPPNLRGLPACKCASPSVCWSSRCCLLACGSGCMNLELPTPENLPTSTIALYWLKHRVKHPLAARPASRGTSNFLQGIPPKTKKRVYQGLWAAELWLMVVGCWWVQHATGHRVTVCSADGARRRVVLPVLPAGHAAHRAMTALQGSLDPDHFIAILSAFIDSTGPCMMFCLQHILGLHR